MSQEPGANVRIILTTHSDQALAIVLVRTLVGESLIACGSVLTGVRSIYRFEGAIHEDEEVQLILKTDVSVLQETIGRLRELHPYKVPEILVISALSGGDDYAAWVAAVTTGLRAR